MRVSSSGGTATEFTADDVSALKTIAGLGLLSLGSANKIIGVNSAGDGYELKSLIAGSNITINQTAGGIEISSTSGGGSGDVESVTVGGLPLSVSGSTTSPVIAIAQASSSAAGFLSSADWNAFNSKLSSVGTSEVSDGSLAPADLNFAGTMATNTGVVVRNGTQFFNLSCSGNEALIWSVANGWICSVVVLTESDPQVGANTTNMLSKWNGSSLVASDVFESGGNVGIGTASPNVNFQVRKGGTVPSYTSDVVASFGNSTVAGTTAAIAVTSGSNGTSRLNLGGTSGADNGQVSYDALTDTMSFSTNDTEKVSILSGGNVGIGTTSPVAKLDVAGEIKLGNTSSACDSTKEGQQRYNSTSKVMEFCDGVEWTGFGKSSEVETIVFKSNTETLTNSTALQFDDHLQFTMVADRKYIIEGTLFRYQIASAGFKVTVTGPASPTTMNCHFVSHFGVDDSVQDTRITSYGAVHQTSTASNYLDSVTHFVCSVENGSSGGTFSIGWAQSVLSASNITVNRGSFLKYRTVP